VSSIDSALLSSSLPDWQLVLLNEVDSTNRYATAHADQLQPPTLIHADQQTAGRGRGGNRWWSTVGALTFSFLIRPGDYGISAEERVRLSLLTAAVLRDVIRTQLSLPGSWLQMKWPNDLYLRGRKACGILLEQAGKHGSGLIVGVGLNVNNSWEHAPEELREKGIALCDVRNDTIDTTALLAAFADSFLTTLEDADLRQATLAAGRQSHLLDGQIVTLERSGDRLTGLCEGIDDDGALLIRDAYGQQRVHSAVILDWEAAPGGL